MIGSLESILHSLTNCVLLTNLDIGSFNNINFKELHISNHNRNGSHWYDKRIFFWNGDIHVVAHNVVADYVVSSQDLILANLPTHIRDRNLYHIVGSPNLVQPDVEVEINSRDAILNLGKEYGFSNLNVLTDNVDLYYLHPDIRVNQNTDNKYIVTIIDKVLDNTAELLKHNKLVLTTLKETPWSIKRSCSGLFMIKS